MKSVSYKRDAMKNNTFTRQKYMDNECSHKEYYRQFVTPRIVNIVSSRIGLERIKNSTNEHLNDIPLEEWDRAGAAFNDASLNKQMRDCGDWTSAAGLVCIAKQAARMAVEELVSK